MYIFKEIYSIILKAVTFMSKRFKFYVNMRICDERNLIYSQICQRIM